MTRALPYCATIEGMCLELSSSSFSLSDFLPCMPCMWEAQYFSAVLLGCRLSTRRSRTPRATGWRAMGPVPLLSGAAPLQTWHWCAERSAVRVLCSWVASQSH